MTDEEARALQPGDRIRLIARVGWDVNPPERDTFTVRRVVNRVGFGGVRIGADDDIWFIPTDVEPVGRGRRPTPQPAPVDSGPHCP